MNPASQRPDTKNRRCRGFLKKQGLEGVIAKRRDSRYEPGRRSGVWVKMRINKGQELVIGGFVPTSKNFDSLIVGYYERDDLIYVARVRNGFIPALRVKVFERLLKLEIKTCPFSNLPQRASTVRRARSQRAHGRRGPAREYPRAPSPASRGGANRPARDAFWRLLLGFREP